VDEQVLKDLYNRAVSKGYKKSIEDFSLLLNKDNDVLNDSYNYVKEQGYGKSIEEFSSLVGVKKKTSQNLLFKRTLRNPLHQQSRKKLSHRMFQFQYKSLALNQYKSKRFLL